MLNKKIMNYNEHVSASESTSNMYSICSEINKELTKNGLSLDFHMDEPYIYNDTYTTGDMILSNGVDKIGTVRLKTDYNEYLTVHNIELIPEYRGRGYGKKIYDSIFNGTISSNIDSYWSPEFGGQDGMFRRSNMASILNAKLYRKYGGIEYDISEHVDVDEYDVNNDTFIDYKINGSGTYEKQKV